MYFRYHSGLIAKASKKLKPSSNVINLITAVSYDKIEYPGYVFKPLTVQAMAQISTLPLIGRSNINSGGAIFVGVDIVIGGSE